VGTVQQSMLEKHPHFPPKDCQYWSRFQALTDICEGFRRLHPCHSHFKTCNDRVIRPFRWMCCGKKYLKWAGMSLINYWRQY